MKKNLPAVVAKLPSKREVRAKISKLKDVSKMRSILGESADSIQQLLEVNDNDSAVALIHKRMLQTLVDLVPYAEQNIRKTKGARGVYQINSLVSSIREVMIDLQNMQDRGALGEALVEKIIRPSYLDIGMHIIQEFGALVTEAKGLMDPSDFKAFKTAFGMRRDNLSAFIQKEYGEVKEECKNFLQR